MTTIKCDTCTYDKCLECPHAQEWVERIEDQINPQEYEKGFKTIVLVA